MATAPHHLIGENEYLHTSYRPDCDYVDGFVLERNLGTHPHGRLQTLIAAYLLQRERHWQIHAVVEVRLKIRERKYRVPDVMVLGVAALYPAVIEEPPLLCIEIVSPDDKLADLVIRAGDYLSMGVPITWILDPETKQAFIYSNHGTVESSEAVLRYGEIEITAGHTTLLRKAFNVCAGAMPAAETDWTARVNEMLQAIDEESTIYLMVRRYL